jgi:hypothetical protein
MTKEKTMLSTFLSTLGPFINVYLKFENFQTVKGQNKIILLMASSVLIFFDCLFLQARAEILIKISLVFWSN